MEDNKGKLPVEALLVMGAIIAMFTMMSLFVLYGIFQNAESIKDLQENGVHTIASVKNKSYKSESNGKKYYILHYEFYDNTAYTHSAQTLGSYTLEEIEEMVNDFNLIEISYDPETLESVEMAYKPSPDYLSALYLFLASVIPTIVGFMLLALIMKKGNNKRIREESSSSSTVTIATNNEKKKKDEQFLNDPFGK